MCSKAEEKSKIICKVCGSELELTEKKHYVATETVSSLLNSQEKWYDAFDCQICGCQYIAGERKRKVRNIIFRELQEDLVSDNVVEEDSFDEESENSDFDCFGNCNESCTIPVTCEKYYECLKATPVKDCSEVSISELNANDKAPKTKLPSCFGKELEDADEECMGCEQLGECLSAPKCFGTKDGIKFVNEVCCKCNAKIRIKCSQIYNEIMKEEGLLEESLELPNEL